MPTLTLEFEPVAIGVSFFGRRLPGDARRRARAIGSAGLVSPSVRTARRSSGLIGNSSGLDRASIGRNWTRTFPSRASWPAGATRPESAAPPPDGEAAPLPQFGFFVSP